MSAAVPAAAPRSASPYAPALTRPVRARSLAGASTEFQADVVKEICKLKAHEGYTLQLYCPGGLCCALLCMHAAGGGGCTGTHWRWILMSHAISLALPTMPPMPASAADDPSFDTSLEVSCQQGSASAPVGV